MGRQPFDHHGPLLRRRAAAASRRWPPTAPPIYFGGASPAAEAVAARHADVYLAWGEPPPALVERLTRVRGRGRRLGRSLRFGVRLHVIARDTADEAWAEADRLLAGMDPDADAAAQARFATMESVGQARMTALTAGSARTRAISRSAPNLWAGIGLRPRGRRHRAGRQPRRGRRPARPSYAAVGFDEFILSGWPHVEEAYRVGEEVLPRFAARRASADARCSRLTSAGLVGWPEVRVAPAQHRRRRPPPRLCEVRPQRLGVHDVHRDEHQVGARVVVGGRVQRRLLLHQREPLAVVLDPDREPVLVPHAGDQVPVEPRRLPPALPLGDLGQREGRPAGVVQVHRPILAVTSDIARRAPSPQGGHGGAVDGWLSACCPATGGARVVLLMTVAAVCCVLQLGVLGSWGRSVRLTTLLLALGLGVYACGIVAVVLQIAWTRGFAAVTGSSLYEVVGVAAYTVDPVIEEVVKVAAAGPPGLAVAPDAPAARTDRPPAPGSRARRGVRALRGGAALLDARRAGGVRPQAATWSPPTCRRHDHRAVPVDVADHVATRPGGIRRPVRLRHGRRLRAAPRVDRARGGRVGWFVRRHDALAVARCRRSRDRLPRPHELQPSGSARVPGWLGWLSDLVAWIGGRLPAVLVVLLVVVVAYDRRVQARVRSHERGLLLPGEASTVWTPARCSASRGSACP